MEPVYGELPKTLEGLSSAINRTQKSFNQLSLKERTEKGAKISNLCKEFASSEQSCNKYNHDHLVSDSTDSADSIPWDEIDGSITPTIEDLHLLIYFLNPFSPSSSASSLHSIPKKVNLKHNRMNMTSSQKKRVKNLILHHTTNTSLIYVVNNLIRLAPDYIRFGDSSNPDPDRKILKEYIYHNLPRYAPTIFKGYEDLATTYTLYRKHDFKRLTNTNLRRGMAQKLLINQQTETDYNILDVGELFREVVSAIAIYTKINNLSLRAFLAQYALDNRQIRLMFANLYIFHNANEPTSTPELLKYYPSSQKEHEEFSDLLSRAFHELKTEKEIFKFDPNYQNSTCSISWLNLPEDGKLKEHAKNLYSIITYVPSLETFMSLISVLKDIFNSDDRFEVSFDKSSVVLLEAIQETYFARFEKTATSSVRKSSAITIYEEFEALNRFKPIPAKPYSIYSKVAPSSSSNSSSNSRNSLNSSIAPNRLTNLVTIEEIPELTSLPQHLIEEIEGFNSKILDLEHELSELPVNPVKSYKSSGASTETIEKVDEIMAKISQFKDKIYEIVANNSRVFEFSEPKFSITKPAKEAKKATRTDFSRESLSENLQKQVEKQVETEGTSILSTREVNNTFNPSRYMNPKKRNSRLIPISFPTSDNSPTLSTSNYSAVSFAPDTTMEDISASLREGKYLTDKVDSTAKEYEASLAKKSMSDAMILEKLKNNPKTATKEALKAVFPKLEPEISKSILLSATTHINQNKMDEPEPFDYTTTTNSDNSDISDDFVEIHSSEVVVSENILSPLEEESAKLALSTLRGLERLSNKELAQFLSSASTQAELLTMVESLRNADGSITDLSTLSTLESSVKNLTKKLSRNNLLTDNTYESSRNKFTTKAKTTPDIRSQVVNSITNRFTQTEKNLVGLLVREYSEETEKAVQKLANTRANSASRALETLNLAERTSLRNSSMDIIKTLRKKYMRSMAKMDSVVLSKID
jgi:hypothetical protein